MLREPLHLSDQEILLVLDGEISRGRGRHAETHLSACWLCRSRMGEMERTIEDFVSAQRRSGGAELPEPDGARALLKARLKAVSQLLWSDKDREEWFSLGENHEESLGFGLHQLRNRSSESASAPTMGGWPRFLQLLTAHRALASVCVAVALSFTGTKLLLREGSLRRSSGEASLLAHMPVPDHTLTPGATRPVNMGDVCSMAHEEVVREGPSHLQQQVFKEYGIVNPRPGDYEIDYLITPGLGGADDIRNLWPEPSKSADWNAHVKDALEERLHQLVCDGKIDLPTAQQAIASDWITAYKKYLGADRYRSELEQLAQERRARL